MIANLLLINIFCDKAYHAVLYLYFIMHNTNQATENITHNNCGKKLRELFFISARAMQLPLSKATNLPSYKTLLSPGLED